MTETDLTASRVVLLGASNLTRNIASVVDLSRTLLGGPLDVLAALGHGRSFGRESRVFWRSLPGIAACGLWRALEQRAAAPTWGLVTDIGNDLAYGVAVPQIIEWVDECLARLGAHCEQLIVTELPLASVAELSPARFLIMRRILFPSSALTFDRALELAQQLNQGVIEVAARHRATIIRQPAEWFGFDPIHIRRRLGRTAWRTILSRWRSAHAVPESDAALLALWRLWWTLRLQRPESRRWFGRQQFQSQPCVILPDGTRVSYF